MNKLEQSIKREANLRILWRRQKEKTKTLEEENKHLLKACKQAFQTIRNIALNLPPGDLRTIANNEASNLFNTIEALDESE